jgi:predicted peroxiredoxin
MKILYVTTSGASDPTRASIPLHLAVNGSLEVGQTVSIVLAGDATELLNPSLREAAEGIGVPTVRELMSKARDHEVPIYV